MAAESSPESWIGQAVSVQLVAEADPTGSLDVLCGDGLEAQLEGVTEYGLMLLMVRYDEVEDERIEYVSSIRGPRCALWGSCHRKRCRPKPFGLPRILLGSWVTKGKKKGREQKFIGNSSPLVRVMRVSGAGPSPGETPLVGISPPAPLSA